MRGRETHIYSYAYDYLNRLTSATFNEYSDAGSITNSNKYNESLTYDLRGNIQTLQRTGYYQNGATCTYGQIDNLTYTYTTNTNRVHRIQDAVTTTGATARGFNPNGQGATNDAMTYDRNGNLNKNNYKNVSAITYNHLNLPTLITFNTGNSIEFLYDAVGTKLRKTVKVGATVQYVQDYLSGGIEYRQNGIGVKRVESVFHIEGRYYNTNVDASNTLSWRREYNIKDHLGNTRVVISDRNANGVLDITSTASTSDVLQENHYYAFGLGFEGPWLQNDAASRDNKYQYNGKELNDDFGLGWNDYGARWYDASVGRWNSVDPLADEQAEWNPYHYTYGNPLNYIDLYGLSPSGAVESSALSICPTCPKDPQYDEYRNNKSLFVYDKETGIVLNGTGVTVYGWRNNPLTWFRGNGILSFPNSVNRLAYAGASLGLGYQNNWDPYNQAGADKRLRYKTMSRSWTLGATRRVLNKIDPLKSKPVPVRYWKTNRGVNIAGAGGVLLGAYGVYSSVNNIMEAENKAKQTFIEGGGWAGAIAGAELFAPIAAIIAPLTGPFAPVTAVVIVGIGGAIGSFGGNKIAEEFADDIFKD